MFPASPVFPEERKKMNNSMRMIAAILLFVMLISLVACTEKGTNDKITLSPNKTLPPLDETEEPEQTDEITEPPVSGELVSNELDGMTERQKVEFLASEIDKFTYTERYEKLRANYTIAGNDYGTTDYNFKFSITRTINEKDIGKDSYARHSDLYSRQEGKSYGENFLFSYIQTDGYSNGYMYRLYDPMKSSPYNTVRLKSPVKLDDYREYIQRCTDGFPTFDPDKEYAGANVSVVPFITGTKWVITYEFTDEIPEEIENYVFNIAGNRFVRFTPQKVTAEITVDILTHAVEGMKCDAVYKTAKDAGESLTLTLSLDSQISAKAKENVNYTPTNFDSYTQSGDLRYIQYTLNDINKLAYCHGNNSFSLNTSMKMTKNGVFLKEINYSDTVSYGFKRGYFVFLLDGEVRYMEGDSYYENTNRTSKYNGKTFSETINGKKTTEEDNSEQSAKIYVTSAFNYVPLSEKDIKSIKVTEMSNGETSVEIEHYFYDGHDYLHANLGFVPKGFEIVKETLTLKITFDEGDKIKNFTYILLGEYNRDGAVIKFTQNTFVSDIKEADLSKIPVFTHDSEL